MESSVACEQKLLLFSKTIGCKRVTCKTGNLNVQCVPPTSSSYIFFFSYALAGSSYSCFLQGFGSPTGWSNTNTMPRIARKRLVVKLLWGSRARTHITLISSPLSAHKTRSQVFRGFHNSAKAENTWGRRSQLSSSKFFKSSHSPARSLETTHITYPSMYETIMHPLTNTNFAYFLWLKFKNAPWLQLARQRQK